MNTTEKIIEFISSEFPQCGKIEPGTPLFTTQLLDSLDLTLLISFIEDTFAIKVGSFDIIYDNFDTAQKMTNYIQVKKNGSSAESVGGHRF